jgi:hypothetical protein
MRVGRRSYRPSIELNCLADPEDVRRLVVGLRLAWAVGRSPELGRYLEPALAGPAPVHAEAPGPAVTGIAPPERTPSH